MLLHLDKKYNINILVLGGRCTDCTHPASSQPEAGSIYSPSPLASSLSSNKYPPNPHRAPSRSSDFFNSGPDGTLAGHLV